MRPEEIDVPTYVDAAAKLIGLPIDPAHRPGVIANMQRNAQMAAAVLVGLTVLFGGIAIRGLARKG